jgi:hypothetical protein
VTVHLSETTSRRCIYIYFTGERGHTPSRGAPCQYLMGGAGSPRLLLPREKLRCVHRRVTTSRCGGIAGLVSLRREFRNVRQYTIQGAHQILRKKPTSAAELRIDLAYLSRGPKHSSTFPSSLLRLRAACVPHAFHPTDEFDAPSVRKDTKPENIRVQPPQGAPTFRLTNIEPACLDACVCVRAYIQEWGGPEAAVGNGS